PVLLLGHVARGIDWAQGPTFAASTESPVLETRGRLSLYHNLVSRHISDQKTRNQAALVYDGPLALNPKGSRGVKQTLSYAQLDQCVRAVALKLLRLGVTTGDAVAAMLACVRIGAVHAVVFGGFAAAELAKRINDAKPKVIIYASCGLEPNKLFPYKPAVDEALAQSAYKPPHLILLNRPELPINPFPADGIHHPFPIPLHYREHEMKTMPDPVVLDAGAPLYLLTLLGVVRDVGGHAVSLKHAMDSVLGVKKGEVFFAASDIGWVVGHTFIVYGPLIQGCTTVLYEGKPIMPGVDGAGAFWRLIQEYKINALYTAPTAIRAIRKEDPDGLLLKKYNLKSLHDVFLAGERCDPDTAVFFTQNLTETGAPITGACVMRDGHLTLPKMGSCGPPVPGYDVRVLVPPKHHKDYENTHENSPGVIATKDWVPASAVKLPLPPGCFPTLWNNHAGYKKSYFEKFPGYYDLTDQGYIDKDGYLTVLGRSDDVLNGEKPIGFIVLKATSAGQDDSAQVERELIAAVRTKIGAVACFDRVVVLKRLPKTRRGLRMDPEVLNEVAKALGAKKTSKL
ncbi:acetyl-CoA synthetase-like protein, partial [Rhizoclosmatium globosum]